MRRTLKIKRDAWIALQLFVFVTVVGAEKPEIPAVIDFLHAHRPCSARSGSRYLGAKEAGLGFVDELFRLLDRIGAAKIGPIRFRLVLIDRIHGQQ